MLDDLRQLNFDIQTISFADVILEKIFSDELNEILEVLNTFEITDTELVLGGGGEAELTQRLRRALAERGWDKAHFTIGKRLEVRRGKNGEPLKEIELGSPSHEIDHVRVSDNGTLALELEWNNKDPFYDRDLENFQRLHHDQAIAAGILITRGSSLQGNLKNIFERVYERNNISNCDTLEIFRGSNLTGPQRRSIESKINDKESFSQTAAKVLVPSKFGQATTHWNKLQARINRGVGAPCPLLCIGLPNTIVVEG